MAIRPAVLTEGQRFDAWGQPCAKRNTDVLAGTFMYDGRLFRCHKKTEVAWRAFEQIRAEHDYSLTGNDSGLYNCRYIGNTSTWSGHAWASAFDVDWLNNPDGKIKRVPSFPKGMTDDIQALKTNSGAFVFRWGQDWDRDPSTNHSYYDPMHFEVVAHPLDLATGIAGLRLEEDMGQVLDKTIKTEMNAVKKLQARLNEWMEYNQQKGMPRLFDALKTDGVYGDKTEKAVRLYQQAAGFLPTGVADAMTVTFLFDTGEEGMSLGQAQ